MLGKMIPTSSRCVRAAVWCALAWCLGFAGISVGAAWASDYKGETLGEGQNAVREGYCAAQDADRCGSFCYWYECVECPRCCLPRCDGSGNEHECGDPNCEETDCDEDVDS